MRSELRLNKTNVEKLEIPQKRQVYYYDDRIQGFCISVTQHGSKIWILYSRLNGSPTRLRLGKYPEMSPEDARKKALEFCSLVASGVDPRDSRKKAKTDQQNGEPTFKDLWIRYLNEHAKPRKKTWREDRANYQRYLLPLAKLRLSEVTRSRIRAIHAGLAAKPYAANRMLSLVSKIFEFADEVEIWNGKNPAKKIRKYPERSRTRFLQQRELKSFFDALRKEEKQFVDFFMLCILTGSRKTKLLEMKAEHVDLMQRTWTIPTTKNGEEIVIHLPSVAVDILRSRPQEGWVFPSHGKSGHLEDPKAAWDRGRETAGLQDLRIHDLRRTLGSWQAMQGASLPIIGKSLGHKSTESTQIYARLSIDPVRESVDRAINAIFPAELPLKDPNSEQPSRDE